MEALQGCYLQQSDSDSSVYNSFRTVCCNAHGDEPNEGTHHRRGEEELFHTRTSGCLPRWLHARRTRVQYDGNALPAC